MSATVMQDICEGCGEPLGKESATCLVEALETFDETLCDNCFDSRCEAAWECQQEDAASEPPMSLDEQHRRAWEQREELRNGR